MNACYGSNVWQFLIQLVSGSGFTLAHPWRWLTLRVRCLQRDVLGLVVAPRTRSHQTPAARCEPLQESCTWHCLHGRRSLWHFHLWNLWCLLPPHGPTEEAPQVRLFLVFRWLLSAITLIRSGKIYSTCYSCSQSSINLFLCIYKETCSLHQKLKLKWIF